ncbi:hypothetical protein WG904_13770 [Pedobacter sp. Du54]|uniref:hypothetical protein n=1 Tax=Pedobacter anseongensis TaxID=3133439 RepID=UPI0030A1D4C5
MNKQFYLFMLWIFCVNQLFAQTNQGSRLTAMGKNGAAVNDVWGVVANPAAISKIAGPTIQLSHQEHYFSKEIRNQGLAFVLPIRRQAFGFNLQRYGIPEYQSFNMGIVATRQFGPKLAIGLRGNYHQLKIDHYGVTSGLSVDVGTIYQLSTELSFGLYLNNLSKQSYRTKLISTIIPSTAYIGIAYRTSSKLLIANTISKNDVALGIDYQFIQALSLRAGISLNPFIHYFGIGFSTTKLLADFSFTKHSNFGYSPQLTIGYVF